MAEDQLGGRLPLLDTDTLDDEQRELVDYLMHTFVPWASTTGFRSQTPDGMFIGPFNSLLRSPALAGQFLQFQTSELQHTSLSDRVRQIVILAVGAVWDAEYELYAHSAVARYHGIPDDTVRSLAAGTAPDTLSDDEKLAYRFIRQLSNSHHVDDATFADTRKAFGDRGIVDMTLLAGAYHSVCGLLNAFEVPAPAASTG